MNHRPTIVNPGAVELHASYGITEARRVALSDALNDMTRARYHGVVMLSSVLDDIALLVANKEEYTWAITTHLMWLAAKGALQNLNHGLLVPRNPPQN